MTAHVDHKKTIHLFMFCTFSKSSPGCLFTKHTQNIRKTNNVASQHLALYFLSHVLKMKGEIEHPLRRMFHCDG